CTHLERRLHRVEDGLDLVARSVVHTTREALVLEEHGRPLGVTVSSYAQLSDQGTDDRVRFTARGSAYARVADQRLRSQEVLAGDTPLLIPIGSRSLDGRRY